MGFPNLVSDPVGPRIEKKNDPRELGHHNNNNKYINKVI